MKKERQFVESIFQTKMFVNLHYVDFALMLFSEEVVEVYTVQNDIFCVYECM